jgi:hypothetical protein
MRSLMPPRLHAALQPKGEEKKRVRLHDDSSSSSVSQPLSLTRGRRHAKSSHSAIDDALVRLTDMKQGWSVRKSIDDDWTDW